MNIWGNGPFGNAGNGIVIGRRAERLENRAHFFSVCAQMMRRILVDSARARGYAKRGGGAPTVSLNEATVVSPERDQEVIAVHEALERLEAEDARRSRVVKLRFFGGLQVDEVAVVLRISRRTVINDWNFAKAWLHRDIQQAL